MALMRNYFGGAIIAITIAAPALAGPTYKFSTSTGTQPSDVGTITLTQVDSTHVQLFVDLKSTTYGFINTGGPHTPFAFSVSGTGALSISSFSLPVNGVYTAPNGSNYTLSLSTAGGYGNTPYGNYGVAIESSGGNGSNKGYFGDLLLVLYRQSGIDTNDFITNGPSGYYFSADLSDGSNTGAQAWTIREIVTGPTPVRAPEPVTLSLMAAGLAGLAGIRRRHRN
jgi:hypothetical protein